MRKNARKAKISKTFSKYNIRTKGSFEGDEEPSVLNELVTDAIKAGRKICLINAYKSAQFQIIGTMQS